MYKLTFQCPKMLVKAEQKPNNEPLPIVWLSSQNIAKHMLLVAGVLLKLFIIQIFFF